MRCSVYACARKKIACIHLTRVQQLASSGAFAQHALVLPIPRCASSMIAGDERAGGMLAGDARAGASGGDVGEGDAPTVTIATGVIVRTEGRTWVPEPDESEVIDGRRFYIVNREDRAFARFLGLDLGARNPRIGVLFIDHIRAARNVPSASSASSASTSRCMNASG